MNKNLQKQFLKEFEKSSPKIVKRYLKLVNRHEQLMKMFYKIDKERIAIKNEVEKLEAELKQKRGD